MSSRVSHRSRSRAARSAAAVAGALLSAFLGAPRDLGAQQADLHDDAAGRYFQPADGCSLYAGVRWRP